MTGTVFVISLSRIVDKVFEEQAAILVTHLKSRADNGIFNIIPYIVRCALDIICITSMDSSPNSQQNAESPYFNAVFRMSELVHQRQTCPWLWPDAVYNWTRAGREHDACLKILHDFTNKVIDERIAERAVKIRDQDKQRNAQETEEEEKIDAFAIRKKRLVFLDLLLEAYDNGEISRSGVREEVDTFMFEGHDTTAAGITWALYLLGRHPEIQQSVREEVDSFLVKFSVYLFFYNLSRGSNFD
ncbi:Cytochrome P450 4V2 [Desmophyllum pertusum]|uniref:Cytochrome P450 4V2 n=1 Tax=Desmophyllum pertusum TaxID=174260 RepID=A0A9X0D0Q1_9CNID|nr:Cytochrome P450 4V2 [Desmophyllum pertusum]